MYLSDEVAVGDSKENITSSVRPWHFLVVQNSYDNINKPDTFLSSFYSDISVSAPLQTQKRSGETGTSEIDNTHRRTYGYRARRQKTGLYVRLPSGRSQQHGKQCVRRTAVYFIARYFFNLLRRN